MRILYVNNDGGGFADHIDVESGITVTQLFAQRLPGRHSADYLIRVNRQPVPADYVLQEGDRLTITPVKIEGAQPDDSESGVQR
jgi:sulfur carrier protein ThiS